MCTTRPFLTAFRFAVLSKSVIIFSFLNGGNFSSFYRNLKKKWEERSHLIGQLEEKVLKMKENFDSKEQTSKEEKDRALKSER